MRGGLAYHYSISPGNNHHTRCTKDEKLDRPTLISFKFINRLYLHEVVDQEKIQTVCLDRQETRKILSHKRPRWKGIYKTGNVFHCYVKLMQSQHYFVITILYGTYEMPK